MKLIYKYIHIDKALLKYFWWSSFSVIWTLWLKKLGSALDFYSFVITGVYIRSPISTGGAFATQCGEGSLPSQAHTQPTHWWTFLTTGPAEPFQLHQWCWQQPHTGQHPQQHVTVRADGHKQLHPHITPAAGPDTPTTTESHMELEALTFWHLGDNL